MSQFGPSDPGGASSGGGPQFGPGPPPSPPLQSRQPYPQPGYAHPYGPPTNGLAIAAIILTFIFAPAGLVLGIIAKNQIKTTGEGGDGLATAAIVVSSVFSAIFVIWFIAVIALVSSAASHFNNAPGVLFGF
jgi:hypothetical protein